MWSPSGPDLLPGPPPAGPERLRLLLDTGMVFTGGAMLIWYVALGPAIAAGPHFDLFSLVTYAYPVGDLLLLFGTLTVLLRGAPVQRPGLADLRGRHGGLHRG